MGEVLSQAEFEDVLRRVREAMEEIPRQYQRLVDNINSVLDWLPGFVLDRIRDALRTVGDFIGKVLTEIGKFVTQPGVPWTLWSHGDSWTNDVGAKASTWQDVFTLGAMRTDDEWTGGAATAYKNVLPQQQRALGAIKAACDEVDDVLTKLAVAIGVAWLAVVSAIVSFVVELTAEAGAAATGVGAPPAAAAAGVSAAKVWGIIAAALGVLEAFVASSLLPATKDLNQRVHTDEGFPQGHWPQLTTDISNSSHRENGGQNAPWEMSKA
ncbi:hypothetical protein [Actinophytocola xanthii]|uniref:Uncharacterized protein n=1 Tax=Actinophytocola xanthii TaxID=1912961 RepID=A0A1Q8BUL0_9PSEU|nr:hypothetical protein [Actinophytocola xanthii]OLF05802.1 hypothetical protein BU204_36870 [Actinophytocola xanthii]